MRKEIKVTCLEVMSHICDSLGEDLDSDRCKDIKTHLEQCPDCNNYFKSVQMTIEYYKKYNVELSPDAHNRLMSFLDLDEDEES
jgi:predicted anti-sigma-YlaC factor YlaD